MLAGDKERERDMLSRIGISLTVGGVGIASFCLGAIVRKKLSASLATLYHKVRPIDGEKILAKIRPAL